MQPIRDLIPHRPPWALIDRVTAATATVVVAEKHVTVDDPLLGARGLGGALVIEALAQTAACLIGLGNPGRGEHRGYLVAARGFRFPSFARPGEIVTLRAEKISELGGLHAFRGDAAVGEREIASGTMSFAIEFAVATGATTRP